MLEIYFLLNLLPSQAVACFGKAKACLLFILIIIINMPVELLSGAGRTINNRVNRAGHTLDRIRALAAAYSPVNPLLFAPHFLEGDALKRLSEAQYQRLMVPPKEVRRNLLLAGAEDVSELRGLVEDRIIRLAGQFADQTNAGFDPRSALTCLDFVSEAMEQMSDRRTGEQAVAHVCRTTLGVLDIIDLYEKKHKKKDQKQTYQDLLNFRLTGRGLEYLLLMTILHDLPEDEFTHSQKERKHPIGAICRRLKADKSEVLVLRQFKPNGTVKEIEVRGGLNDYDIVSLDHSLAGLKTGHIENGSDALVALKEANERISKQESLYGPDIIRHLAIPIVKMVDRDDNLHTYTFRLKGGCSFAVDDDSCFEANPLDSQHKLVEKVSETINYFVYPEFLFAVFMSDNRLLNLLLYQGLQVFTKANPYPILANPQVL